jgi:hypothetical protein
MIKYADVKGYKNLGEIQLFSHLYQFIELDNDTPMIILVHAYECDTQIFKGYVFNNTNTYKSIPLTNEELISIETYTGKANQINFDKFIIGTIIEEACKDYKEKKE